MILYNVTESRKAESWSVLDFGVVNLYAKSRVLKYWGHGRLKKGNRHSSKNQSTFTYLFIVSFFIYRFFSCRALPSRVRWSLPFFTEKRSCLLHESEGIFVALLGNQSVRRHESTTVIVVSRGNFAWQQQLDRITKLVLPGTLADEEAIWCADELFVDS